MDGAKKFAVGRESLPLCVHFLRVDNLYEFEFYIFEFSRPKDQLRGVKTANAKYCPRWFFQTSILSILVRHRAIQACNITTKSA